MNTQSINQCPKVGKRVQLCLEASPVIARFPILHQRTCLGDGTPPRPVLHWLCVGESGSSKARAEIVNGFLRNRDMKQTDLFRGLGYQRLTYSRHSWVALCVMTCGHPATASPTGGQNRWRRHGRSVPEPPLRGVLCAPNHAEVLPPSRAK